MAQSSFVNSAVSASVTQAWSVGLVGVPDGVAAPELADSEALSVEDEVPVPLAVSEDVDPEVEDAAGKADRARERDADVEESEARLAESDDADSAFVVVPDPEVADSEDVPVPEVSEPEVDDPEGVVAVSVGVGVTADGCATRTGRNCSAEDWRRFSSCSRGHAHDDVVLTLSRDLGAGDALGIDPLGDDVAGLRHLGGRDLLIAHDARGQDELGAALEVEAEFGRQRGGATEVCADQ